jgi:tRNA G18 (ribose-2'-O)-methylase SpoU
MPRVIPVTSLDDPRLAVFRNLKDRDLKSRHGRFIAEGEFVVRRLLRSSFQTESLLLSQNKCDEIAAIAPAGVPVFCAPHAVVNQIVGYRFHSGVMAAGVRRAGPNLAEVVPPVGPALIVVCPETNNAENLGGLIRLAAGFGATAVLLGERCHDPFARQTIRVSMGTIFSIPIVQSDSIVEDLNRLAGMNVRRVATVLDHDATPLTAAQNSTGRIALLFGNEAQGLSREHIALCDDKVTIPMRLGTDSLNVAVAAGIILYHYARMSSPDFSPSSGG